MKHGRQETVCYTIEREFLAKITVAEFVNRMIQTHIKNQSETEAQYNQSKRLKGKGL